MGIFEGFTGNEEGEGLNWESFAWDYIYNPS